ncbi:fimbrial protein [Serratia marcescens]|jgi:type 1 fimbria pilin|uniref:fimbrial protein n=1 Tax=Serratia TaxID=613 RepID=UPI0009C3BBC0|nr:fimbrial protein [Serratia marcescens]AQT64340.2 pilus assembly protein [Serratia marcescens]EIG9088092.1 fimbrial protein [Serratia marcescens]MBH3005380.1 fimbrial protein [Serratia marcescens]MBH3336684.1 fimbrial protein [Serratia marcescens]
MIRRVVLKILLFIGMLSFNIFAWAIDGDMSFHGTLIEPPPCVISGGQRVEVDFGDVGVNKVDGVNYRRGLNYQVTCEDITNSGKWGLKMSLSGNGTGFDKNALVTSKANLGIRLYQNDVLFTPGSSIDIDLDNLPRLEAVLVKETGSILAEGAFEALATLRADYQ